MDTTRRDFTRLLSALGITGAAPGWLTGCKRPPFEGDVVIIGAGAAGLTAGFLLDQAGIPFTVLEASAVHGGRLRKDDTFVDFPIDLGGEWVHVSKRVLNRLSQTADATDRAIEFRPMTGGIWDGTRLIDADDEMQAWRGEYRFKDTTWYDFFHDLIAPPVIPHIRYDTPVAEIAYDREGAVVTTVGGETFSADRVIYTAPLRVLIDGDIAFDPPLPRRKTDVFADVDMPGGIKVFIEFSERFYPDGLVFGTADDVNWARTYYNVALDKPTERHVLGLFAWAAQAPQYTDFDSDDDRIAHILAELDEIFDGAASRTYLQHRTQNWTAEPYIRGSYSKYADWRDVRTLGEPLDDVVYFAGEAYNLRDNWGFAHLASQAAYDVVDAILGR